MRKDKRRQEAMEPLIRAKTLLSPEQKREESPVLRTGSAPRPSVLQQEYARVRVGLVACRAPIGGVTQASVCGEQTRTHLRGETAASRKEKKRLRNTRPAGTRGPLATQRKTVLTQ